MRAMPQLQHQWIILTGLLYEQIFFLELLPGTFSTRHFVARNATNCLLIKAEFTSNFCQCSFFVLYFKAIRNRQTNDSVPAYFNDFESHLIITEPARAFEFSQKHKGQEKLKSV
jgi:hypothetical protein